MSLRAITVFTHGRPEETSGALSELAAMAAAEGAVLTLDADESAKHPVRGEIEGLALDTPPARDAELCVALGGDGTILRALRAYARTSVPVFAVNFGEVGFLSTVEPERMREGFARALAGTLDVLSLPAIEVEGPAGTHVALNDLSLHRKVGGRVAELSYAIGEDEVGSVRCDGLVVATPAGSTGYNLANGGPVMAWGVAGMAVSFIAPHSLSARALVVAPDDVLMLHNSSRETLAVSVDGRPVGEIAPAEVVCARFAYDVATLAQIEGSSFYLRLREKFGRLSR
ncbi:MAG: NAD(+)/NADH kinase [Solirubrobacteraceae bacterium]|jgi:NAD+ kinase